RMSNLTLSDRTIQHRMSRNSLISRRSKNLQLTQPLTPQSVNQIARTRTAINRHQRETRFTLHQEINQPLRAFTHRSLPNRLHMNRPITATHSTRHRHMRPIRSELHAEALHTTRTRVTTTTTPQPRPKRTPPLLPLIPNPQALTLERHGRPQQLPHTQDRALTRTKRERRISLRPLPTIVRAAILIRRQLHIQHVRIIARQRRLTPRRENLARISRTRRSAHHQHQPISCSSKE